MVLTIAAAIFVFGLLVLVHELGHFITAKLTGMRVDEFAIGFGPKLISFTRGETVYSLRAI
ncbi:MAG: M50 family metallopeptidase, partial [Selenomonas sp.]|nr:M50 family metallopeptidase [Selenomonas sp.]